MSGLKRSRLVLVEEQQRRYRLASEIAGLQGAIRGVSIQLGDTLRTVPQDLLRRLEKETHAAQGWLAKAELRALSDKSVAMETPSSVLSSEATELRFLLEKGKVATDQLLTRLNHAYHLQSQLSTRLARVTASLESNHDLIERWVGSDQVHRLESAVDEVGVAARGDPFPAWQTKLEALETEVGKAIAQAEQAEQISQDARARRELDSCRYLVQSLLRSVPEGLRETFAEAVARATNWLGQAKRASEQSPQSELSAERLRSLTEGTREMTSDGRAIATSLQRVLSEEAPALREHMRASLNSAEELFKGGQDLLGSWCGRETVAGLRTRLDGLHRRLDQDRLLEGADLCLAFQTEVENMLRDAEGLEAKHQRRLYLLKALRKVCADMGFGEAEVPHYEREGDLRSRLQLTVDTFDQGLVLFYLSLEAIEAQSDMARTECLGEFDKLSAELKRRYGVATKFEVAGAESSPRLRQKGEKEEPDAGQAALAA